ncbi:sensor domain-containing protein [Jatrophihabitans fulvus]
MTSYAPSQHRPGTPQVPTRPAGPLVLRLWVTARAAAFVVTSMIGVALLPLWLTLLAVSPLTLVVPLAVGATALVRAYADANRHAAGRMRGEVVSRPYRPAGPGLFGRHLAAVRDPASWRDALWMSVHAVVGFFTATLTVTLALATLFWAVFPFLYAVTPQAAFGRFLGFVTIHSVAQSFVVVPLAAVALALWWVLAVPLARADAAVTARLLGPRRVWPDGAAPVGAAARPTAPVPPVPSVP